MRSTILRVLLLAPILTLMLGCDSKSSSSTQSTEPTTNSQAQEAILTPEQQAHQKTLEEIEQLTAPYIALNKQLLDRGGIDPATLASIEDIDTRISMINQLNDYNTYILEQYPILFNTLQGADTPKAVRQLKLVQDIRALNTEIYPHMKSSLQIARQHFAVSGLANDNNFYFGDEVPKDAVDQYNAHLTAVDSITQQQDDLMAAYNAQVQAEQAEQAQQDEQAEP